jgi:hypothetical protein
MPSRTSGAACAPQCLKRNAGFVASAESGAQMRPTPTAGEMWLSAGRLVGGYAALGMIHPAMATKWLTAARITSE